MSVLTVSVDVGDGGGEGILVLEMSEEDRELCPLHVEAASIELIVGRGKGVGNVVEFAGELGVLVLKVAVLVLYISATAAGLLRW
jgi:hypothetical protein